MKTLLASLTVILGFTYASEGRAKIKEAVRETRNGNVGVAPVYGLIYPRLLNTDGTFSSFSGTQYGPQITLRLTGDDETPGLTLFGQYLLGTAKETNQDTTLSRNELSFGVAGNIVPSLYGYFSYGQHSVKVSKFGYTDTMLVGRVLGIGSGLDLFSLGSSLTVNVQAWYKTGIFKKNENTDLTSNSAYESFEFFLTLRWSPTLTFTFSQ